MCKKPPALSHAWSGNGFLCQMVSRTMHWLFRCTAQMQLSAFMSVDRRTGYVWFGSTASFSSITLKCTLWHFQQKSNRLQKYGAMYMVGKTNLVTASEKRLLLEGRFHSYAGQETLSRTWYLVLALNREVQERHFLCLVVVMCIA